MKVLHLNTFDIEGGAARAAYRIHKGLEEVGIRSNMLVQKKSSDDTSIINSEKKWESQFKRFRGTIDSLPLKFYNRKSRNNFSINWFPNKNLLKIVKKISPDIVHLHWIADGHMPISQLKYLGAPIIWTLHDMWPFTGGCHYTGECENYKTECKKCPELKSDKNHDLSSKTFKSKKNNWEGLNINIVTPSKWLKDCASSSFLFKERNITVIPYRINLSIFRPHNKDFARNILGLPPDKKLILFGAMGGTSDSRKGFQYLLPALQRLTELNKSDDFALLIYGSLNSDFHFGGIKSYFLGRLYDDYSLALAYSAADVFVAPSIQDNLPNTVVESLACGTPVVAFNIGGMPDMIEHLKNGYLAHPYDFEQLMEGIVRLTANKEVHSDLSSNAVAFAQKNFNTKTISEQYIKLYSSILESSELKFKV